MGDAYRVLACRVGTLWHIDVPAIGNVTQAYGPHEVEAMARELIALTEDVPADSFEVDVRCGPTPAAGS